MAALATESGFVAPTAVAAARALRAQEFPEMQRNAKSIKARGPTYTRKEIPRSAPTVARARVPLAQTTVFATTWLGNMATTANVNTNASLELIQARLKQI